MTRIKPLLAFALAGALGAANAATTTGVAEDLRSKALADHTAYDLAESLTTEVGARPAGSPEFAHAKDWALSKLTLLGFRNVHAEPFLVDRWVRGPESASLSGAIRQPLRISGLNGSPSTPPEGVEGEIVIFKRYDDLLKAPVGSLKGKVAVVTQRMEVTSTIAGFNGVFPLYRKAAVDAAERGAIAYLARSKGYGNARIPHTGSGLSEGAPELPIPAAVLSNPDADLVERAAERSGVKISLSMQSHVEHNAQSWNVVGEIPGRSDQIVLLGGHLDSWDVGTGAVDDAAGIAMAIAAAKLVGTTKPEKTLRVVLFGGEEISAAGPAYAAAHSGELSQIAVAGESDLGAGKPTTVRLPAGALASPAMADLPDLLRPLNVQVSSAPATLGGADPRAMQQKGVPVFWILQDLSEYFRWHHSDDDTFDKIDPDDLSLNVAALSMVALRLANDTADYRMAPAK